MILRGDLRIQLIGPKGFQVKFTACAGEKVWQVGCSGHVSEVGML